jgi:hypothetical protein
MTISPNYTGDTLEYLDREVLVVSANVPLKLARMMSSAYSARTLMLHELCVVKMKKMQLQLPQVSPQAMLYQVSATNSQATSSTGDHPHGSGRSSSVG